MVAVSVFWLLLLCLPSVSLIFWVASRVFMSSGVKGEISSESKGIDPSDMVQGTCTMKEESAGFDLQKS